MKTLILLVFVLPLADPPVTPAIESQATPQPPLTFAIGEVTGTEVNIRSGPSENYYVVTRLSAGQRVVIVDRRPSWVAIAPPERTYSLIAREYIDPMVRIWAWSTVTVCGSAPEAIFRSKSTPSKSSSTRVRP